MKKNTPLSSVYPGRYWVEVQANMTASCCGEGGWTDRTATALNATVLQNAGGFFGACFSGRCREAPCDLDPSAPDQVYRLKAAQIFVPGAYAIAKDVP